MTYSQAKFSTVLVLAPAALAAALALNGMLLDIKSAPPEDSCGPSNATSLLYIEQARRSAGAIHATVSSSVQCTPIEPQTASLQLTPLPQLLLLLPLPVSLAALLLAAASAAA